MSDRQLHRIKTGGRIDRARPIPFFFNGKAYQGFEGDTLASALLANGVKVVNRSFKYHRPRGVFSCGVEEPNALLGVDVGNGMLPVTRATLFPLKAGLRSESQTAFPSLDFDVGRVLDFSRKLWPAGFYNKIFKWPNWHSFEWAIRKMAGLGHAPGGEDKARYRHMNRHCDVLVVGSGPAGLRAAADAAQRGLDVLLVEQDVEAGGSSLYDHRSIEGKQPEDWRNAIMAELEGNQNAKIMCYSTVSGYYDHNMLSIHDRRAAYKKNQPVETFWKVRAGQVILATGAIEQPMLFANNDIPGIMLATAMLQYTRRYAVAPSASVVVLVNNDMGWDTAFALHAQGIAIKAIVDTRSHEMDGLASIAAGLGITTHVESIALRAKGSRCVKSLTIQNSQGEVLDINCDGIAIAGGFNPTVHLYSQAGGKLRYDDSLKCFVPLECRQKVSVVGAANGEFANPATYRIAERCAAPVDSAAQWVDLVHDVTVSDIELAVRENFVSVEHLKRYTTTGMAVDQGKTSNLNALSLLGQLTNRSAGDVGTTTFRPQFMPVTMNAIAGNRLGQFYQPTKRLLAESWHITQGAVFDDYGAWSRPAYYGSNREESIKAEIRAVRESVGLFDGSPLGKIEVKGPHAAEFLNFIYVNNVLSLKPGKVRYGLMLNENGIIIDDGVFIRIAEDHFLVNTTSGGADRIAAWLEEWHQCELPQLKVIIAPVTAQWGVVAVVGRHSREILQSLSGMIDIQASAFPHMSFGTGTFDDGMPFRLQRVSYSGELSYELSVPTNCTTLMFEQLMTIGAQFNIRPFGVEAVLLLRVEKGYIHVGADTDGMTHPGDVGFGRIAHNKAHDFVGARSLQRDGAKAQGRRQLVGFEQINSTSPVQPGAHFVSSQKAEKVSEGFVTSAIASVTIGKVVGLGLLKNGFQRKGEEIDVFDDGVFTRVRIVDSCFYDAKGEMMNA